MSKTISRSQRRKRGGISKRSKRSKMGKTSTKEKKVNKWLVIVGYEHMSNFGSLHNLCSELSDIHRYSPAVDTQGGYKLVVVSASGRVRPNHYESLFQELGIKENDEVMVFYHVSRDENGYGSKPEDLAAVSAGRNSLRYLPYHTASHVECKNDNYGYWYVIVVHTYLSGSNAKLSIWGDAPSWEEVTNATLPKPADQLSILKHDVVHLFAPLDCDLQSADRQPAEERPAYLCGVFREKQKGWFSGRLVTLQNVVASVSANSPRSTSEKFGEGAGGKTVLALLDEAARADRKVKAMWRRLLTLCGMNCQEDDSFGSGKIQADSTAPICRFFALLDEAASQADKSKLTSEKTEAVLRFFKGCGESKDWQVTGLAGAISSFHDWCVAVGDCLEAIRDRIQTIEQGKTRR